MKFMLYVFLRFSKSVTEVYNPGSCLIASSIASLWASILSKTGSATQSSISLAPLLTENAKELLNWASQLRLLSSGCRFSITFHNQHE